MKSEDIAKVLAPFGLKLRGIAALNDDDIQAYGFAGQSSVALVGNTGSSFWTEFSQSPEYLDGQPDPLDRWSLRLANEIAPKLNATPVFPFQGPPYFPFQQWARRAEALYQSPIGLMIHPRYGLWHAYRFALLIAEPVETTQTEHTSPCLNCEAQPCLQTCPVKAFSKAGYDVDSCADYLKQTPSADCFQHGCMARFICPAGRKHRYLDAQSEFHLRAFISARLDVANP